MSTEADHLGDLTEIPDGSQTASDDAAAVPVSQDTATAVTAEDGAGHSDENNEGHEDGAAAALPTPNATHSGFGQTAADTPLPSTPPKEGSSLLDTTTDLAAQLATPSASGPAHTAGDDLVPPAPLRPRTLLPAAQPVALEVFGSGGGSFMAGSPHVRPDAPPSDTGSSPQYGDPFDRPTARDEALKAQAGLLATDNRVKAVEGQLRDLAAG